MQKTTDQLAGKDTSGSSVWVYIILLSFLPVFFESKALRLVLFRSI